MLCLTDILAPHTQLSGVASSDSSTTCPPFAPGYPIGCPYITSVGATEAFTPERAVGPDLAGSVLVLC